jgi:hypothetical protein
MAEFKAQESKFEDATVGRRIWCSTCAVVKYPCPDEQTTEKKRLYVKKAVPPRTLRLITLLERWRRFCWMRTSHLSCLPLVADIAVRRYLYISISVLCVFCLL